MKQKSIYIAYTGGTIGMRSSRCGYIPAAGHLQQQLERIPELQHQRMPNFTLNEYQPLIDSSNMIPDDWQRIANDIQSHYDQYDGFIILHGTDTMAFTSSALSFMLENLAKPVIVTGSQIPIAELRSDGQTNLLNALYLITHHPINEVTLFFNNKLFRGNRTIKRDADGFDAFSSPNFPILLESGIQIRHFSYPTYPTHTDYKMTVHRIRPQPIAVITLYPGISANILANFIEQPIKALILRTYGVGNAPQDLALLNQLKKASTKGIIVINLTQCIMGKVNMEGYATGHALIDVGVISGADMTLEATLAKLHYLFSSVLSTSECIRQLQQNLRGELTEN